MNKLIEERNAIIKSNSSEIRQKKKDWKQDKQKINSKILKDLKQNFKNLKQIDQVTVTYIKRYSTITIQEIIN